MYTLWKWWFSINNISKAPREKSGLDSERAWVEWLMWVKGAFKFGQKDSDSWRSRSLKQSTGKMSRRAWALKAKEIQCTSPKCLYQLWMITWFPSPRQKKLMYNQNTTLFKYIQWIQSIGSGFSLSCAHFVFSHYK